MRNQNHLSAYFGSAALHSKPSPSINLEPELNQSSKKGSGSKPFSLFRPENSGRLAGVVDAAENPRVVQASNGNMAPYPRVSMGLPCRSIGVVPGGSM